MARFGDAPRHLYDGSVIDTLKAARAFRKAGFTEAQADAVAHTLKQSVEGCLVTKVDLGVTTQELRTELQALRAEMQVESQVLRTEIQSLRADVYRQLWVMAAGIVGVTVTLIKLLP